MSVGGQEGEDVGIGGVGSGLDPLGVLLQDLVVSLVLSLLLICSLGFAEVLDTALEIPLDDLQVIRVFPHVVQLAVPVIL